MSLYLELAIDVDRLGYAGRNRDDRCHDVVLKDTNPLLLGTFSSRTCKCVMKYPNLEPLHTVDLYALILLSCFFILNL